MMWLCWIRHDYGKWGKPFDFGGQMYQKRQCQRCGKIQESWSRGWFINQDFGRNSGTWSDFLPGEKKEKQKFKLLRFPK